MSPDSRFTSLNENEFVVKTVKDTLDLPSNNLAATILTWIGMGIMFFFSMCTTYSFFLGPTHNIPAFGKSRSSLGRRSLFWLLMYCIVALICGSITTFLLMSPYNAKYDNDLAYGIALPPINSSFYVIAHFCAYQFLWTRNQLINFPVKNQQLYNYLKNFSWTLMMALPFMFPLLLLFFWRHKTVVVDGLQYSIPIVKVEIVMLFAICDPILSISFLLLFIWPLYEHTKTMKQIADGQVGVNDDSLSRNNQMLRVMKRTTFFAIIGAIITFTAMLFLTISEIKNVVEGIKIWTEAIPVFEMNALLPLCLFQITNIWQPPIVKRIFKGLSDQEEENISNLNKHLSSKIIGHLGSKSNNNDNHAFPSQDLENNASKT